MADSSDREAAPVAADRRGAGKGHRLWRPGTSSLISLLAALLIIGLLAIDLWRSYHQTEDQAFLETMGLERVYESHVVNDVHAVDDMLATFSKRVKELDAASPSGFRVGPGGYDTALLDTIEQDGRMLLQSLPAGGLALVDNSGRVIASTVLPRGYELGTQDYMVSALANATPDRSNFGAAMRGPVGGGLLVPLSRAAYRDDGSIIGIAVTTLDPVQFVAPFQSMQSQRFSTVTIVQRDGLVIARAPGGQELIGKSIAQGELFLKHLFTAPEGFAKITGSLVGRGLITSYRAIPEMPFVVVSAFDAEDVFRPWYRMAATYMALGFVAILAIGWCGWLLARDQARRHAVATASRIRAIIDGMASFVILFSTDGRILEINHGSLQQGKLGRDDVIGRPLWQTAWCSFSDAAQEKTRSLILRAASGEKIRDDLIVRIGPDAYRTLDITLQPVEQADGNRYVIGSAFDVTDQRQLEEKLRNAQKMEALGLLAGGIAHDFNNLLASMSNYSQFLAEDLEPSSAQFGFADRIRRACSQGKEMVAQILTYARPNEVKRKPIDLLPIVQEVRELVEAIGTETIALEWNIPFGDQRIVVANRAQLTQILLNLCINAIDAIDINARSKMNALGGYVPSDGDHLLGVVRVSLDISSSDDPNRLLRPREMASPLAVYRSGSLLPDQRYARVTVRDTGSGMSQEVLQRIFDPFFTTKTRSKGTGLGLAVVHSIVTSLSGIVEVESTLGDGSIFAIYLPLCETTAQKSERALPA